MRVVAVIAAFLGLMAVIVGAVTWWMPAEVEDPMNSVYLTITGGVGVVCSLLFLSLFASPRTEDWRLQPEWGDRRPRRKRSPRPPLPELPPLELPELGTVVAERSYVLHSGGETTSTVRLKVGQPALGDQGWACPWQLEGLEEGYLHVSFGEDSVAAIDRALHDAPAVLEERAQAESAYLTYRGHRRLGFGELCQSHLRERSRARRHRRQRGTVVVPVLSFPGPSPDRI